MKLNGNKTYIVAAGIILAAVGGFLQGDMAMGEAVNQVLVGLGLAGVRHGVKTGE